MTLEEAFEKYDDSVFLRRRKTLEKAKQLGLINYNDKESLHYINNFLVHDIKWLKGMYGYGKNRNESMNLGFAIPKFYEEDSNADDWEVIDKC